MKRAGLIIFLLLKTSLFFSQKKSEILTGAFINSIYDLNLPEESFKIDMWIWCTYKDTNLKMNKLIEFPNTKEFSFSNDVLQEKDSYQWLTMRATGEVMKNWKSKNFPFDKQILNVSLGFSFDTSTGYIVADTNNSKIDPDFKLNGWKIDQVKFKSGTKVYTTNFGDPSIAFGKSTYPEFNIEVFISREDSIMTLTKLILGLIIAFLISCCVFFIKPINTDPRFGLCVGGLFTAVGNKYITDSFVPYSNQMTLIDNLHSLTFVSIFLIIIQSVVSLWIFEKGLLKSEINSKKFDLYSFGVIFIFYVASCSVLIFNASIA
jgi:hypothetical protein